MRFPSPSTCVISVTASAEYGAPVTVGPPSNSPPRNATVAGAPPSPPSVWKKMSFCCARSAAAELKKIKGRVFISPLPLSEILYETHKTNGARHPFFADEHIGLNSVIQPLFADGQSYGAHGARRHGHAKNL